MAPDDQAPDTNPDENAQPTTGNPDPAVPPAAPDSAPAPAPALAPTDKAAKKNSRFEKFIEATGFDPKDVDIRRDDGVYGTVQGGKYRLLKNGDVITLKGPVPNKPAE